jgi:hypothetical protein
MTNPVNLQADGERALLRHTLATLAYRGGKALRNAPEGFARLSVAEGSRTPVEILGHIGDLFDWALTLAKDKQAWTPATVKSWDEEHDRFFTTITALDEYLADYPIARETAEQLFRGPIADALTHIGQIALMRRMAGSPVRGENYVKAMIVTGRTGPDQEPPAYEFD